MRIVLKTQGGKRDRPRSSRRNLRESDVAHAGRCRKAALPTGACRLVRLPDSRPSTRRPVGHNDCRCTGNAAGPVSGRWSTGPAFSSKHENAGEAHTLAAPCWYFRKLEAYSTVRRASSIIPIVISTTSPTIANPVSTSNGSSPMAASKAKITQQPLVVPNARARLNCGCEARLMFAIIPDTLTRCRVGVQALACYRLYSSAVPKPGASARRLM